IARSPEKRALARALGAEVIDAGGDPVLEVCRATRGQGVHAVFELVASDESMPAALAMLRRRGRLILVGYGSARLRVNPLELVLRETQLLGSLGNTRAELAEVVRLAAGAALKVPIAGQYALEDVSAVLDALRAGRLAGRGVIVPSAPVRLSLWERPRAARVRGGYEISTPAQIRTPHPSPLPEGEGAGARPLTTELLEFV